MNKYYYLEDITEEDMQKYCRFLGSRMEVRMVGRQVYLQTRHLGCLHWGYAVGPVQLDLFENCGQP